MAAANSDQENVLLQSDEGSPSAPPPAAGRLPFKASVAVGLCVSAAGLAGAVMMGRPAACAPTKIWHPWSAIDLNELQYVSEECKILLKALEKEAEEQGRTHEVDSFSGETLDCKKSEQACTVQCEMPGILIVQTKCFPAVCKQVDIFKEVEANMAGMPAEAQPSSINVSCATPDTAKEVFSRAAVAITLSSPPNVSDIAQSEQHPHDPCDNGISKLPQALNLVEGVGFERVNLCRCALVGASSNLLGSMAGDVIDSYDTVIRVNRIPRGAIQRDVGNKTDVLVTMLHPSRPQEPKVEVMSLGGNGQEPPRVSCSLLDNCRNTAIVMRADDKNDRRLFGPCDPQKLADAWGRDRPFVACIRPIVDDITWGFSQGNVQVHKHMPSTGFVAFVTFLPLCKELDLFGFGGTATSDGHLESIRHDLVGEHHIQDAIAAGQRPDWIKPHGRTVRRPDPDALNWIWQHGAKVRKVSV